MDKKYLDFSDLDAYKRAFNLSNFIWDIVIKWAYFPKITVGKQIVDSADSISANIAEGFGRYSKKDKIRFYRISYGSLKEVVDWKEKSNTRKLITKEEYKYIEVSRYLPIFVLNKIKCFMELYNGQNLIEFAERFKSNEDCKEYLAYMKWTEGYECLKCGHKAGQKRRDFSMVCNKCSHIESATANTLFHKVKFGIRKAFFICFEMSTTTKSLSASHIGVRFGITEKTARLFMHKVREAMKSSENHPIDGNVHIDEFVVGGKEVGAVGRSYHTKKKKIVCAVELTDEGKVKRMYSMRIDNYSSKELKLMFEKHISEKAKVVTDKWKGYRPLMKQYNIEQIESNHGMNFKALHTMIHQVKSWIRTTYSWVSESNIDRYLDEFSYRINRSQSKENIFNNLVRRMVVADKMYQTQIVCT